MMKAEFFKKYRFMTCVLAGIMLAAMIFGFSDASTIAVSSAKRDLPIYCVDREQKVVSLTFDAAWGNEDTQTLIDILGKYNIKATFFVVGDWVDKYPESVKALSDAGHEIMNHSNKHPYMTKLSEKQMIDEINACNDKIEAITGVRPILFRPPYGDYNDAVVSTLRNIGMYTIQWDVDSLDWKNLGSDNVRERVISKVKPGSIVLFHNAAVDTPPALPGIIEELIRQGYSFAKVSELIYTEDYTIDHTGKQIKNVDNGERQ